jgi:hypothetical protein
MSNRSVLAGNGKQSQDENLSLNPDYNLVLYGQTNQSQLTAEQAAAAGGVLLVAQGGTGANNQSGARTNLGLLRVVQIPI